jgi:hypothetical protein
LYVSFAVAEKINKLTGIPSSMIGRTVAFSARFRLLNLPLGTFEIGISDSEGRDTVSIMLQRSLEPAAGAWHVSRAIRGINRSVRVNRSGVAERQNSLQTPGVMATNLTPISPDALLRIVEQVKEYYVDLPPQRRRGRPRTFSGRAFLLLAVVGVVLRTFKPQELVRLLTQDLTLRQGLGFERVPHRRTIERRLDATLPEAEAQVQALGHQLLAEVELGPDEPQASAIAGRLYQAQGPRWHKRDRAHGRVPAGLRNVDTESAWAKSGSRGWVQGYRLVLQGLVFPAPVPLFARWCPNVRGESTVLEQALAAEQVPVTELLLGDATFGGADLRATSAQHGGWLLTPQQLPTNPDSWKRDLYAYRRETIELLFQRLIQACDLKTCPTKGLARTGTFVIASVWLYQVLFLENYRPHRPVAHIKEIIDEGRWRIAA